MLVDGGGLPREMFLAAAQDPTERNEILVMKAPFRLLYVLPALLLLISVLLPLMLGTETLYSRDVLTAHYGLKAAQARLMQAGELPLVDPYRAGGQPLVGNLNSLPLYPTNLLYLLASPLWALNAHFWLHLLLAPFGVYWLGRAWGLGRPASWAAGVAYGGSGYMLSQMNLYNLVAGTALAPAFAALFLRSWHQHRRGWRLAVLGLLWTLLILAGDPLLAILALVLGLSAGLAKHRSLPRRPQLVAASLVLGSLVALPQIVETLRILPLSYRGHWGYSELAALAQSWDPKSAIEWLLPMVFGEPGFGFWGTAFYGGNPPLFYSLYPGILCLCLLVVAGWPRLAATRWAWAMMGLGGFFALGFYNPIIRAVHGLPGTDALRYPVKVWLVVAVGASLLVGFGFERLLQGEGEGRRRLWQCLGVLAVAYGFALGLLTLGPAPLLGRLQALVGPAAGVERVRWATLCLLSLAILALFALALAIVRRDVRLGGALLLAIHLVSQTYLLQPLIEGDDAEHYGQPPSLLAQLPEEGIVAHGGDRGMFGSNAKDLLGRFPDLRTFWLTRQNYAELYGFAGVQWGRRHEMNFSPEGLDSFFTISLSRAFPGMDEAAKVRVLAASGVEVLVLDRELDPAARQLVSDPYRHRAGLQDLYLYRLRPRAPEVALMGKILEAPHLNATLSLMVSPDFDPRHTVVLAGEGAPTNGPPGTVEILAEDTEELRVRSKSAAAGVLLVQRTYLPLYKATVDGEDAEVLVANFHRIGVRVPAGSHEVRLWVNRRPFHQACLGALAALLGLGLLVLREGGTDAEGVSEASPSPALSV